MSDKTIPPDTARLGLLIAVVDLKRRLWTLEDAGRDSISLNDVWTLLKPVDESIKELQAATREQPFETMRQAYDQGFVHGQHDAQTRALADTAMLARSEA